MDVIERGGRRRSIHRRVSSGGSFGANALHQTLGIGRAVKIESLEVYWPTSDRTDRYEAVEANRSYRIVEGEARLVTLR